MTASAPDPERILAYRVGQLGDTIVALPAIWDLRRRFPRARIDLLHNVDAVGNTVDARALLAPTGIFAGFIPYRVATGMAPLRALRACGNTLAVLHAVRAGRYQALAYLAPTLRTTRQRHRDALFFRACGIDHLWGVDAPAIGQHDPAAGVGEAELLRRQLGHAVGPPCMDLGITTAERELAATLLSNVLPGRGLLAVAPGSAMPAKLWPTERFIEACSALSDRHDFHVVVLGGPADVALGARMNAALPGRCLNLCGQAPPRVTVALLERCRLLLGNDSGNIHLGACAGVPTVGVFSARNYPGRWHPVNPRAIVLRLDVPCVGCGLRVCPVPGHPCIEAIGADRVVSAAESLLVGGTSRP